MALQELAFDFLRVVWVVYCENFPFVVLTASEAVLIGAAARAARPTTYAPLFCARRGGVEPPCARGAARPDEPSETPSVAPVASAQDAMGVGASVPRHSP